MGKLNGKIALITGGTSGIGLATAKRFADEGAHVFITGRREAELEAAVNQIGRNVTGIQGDVSKIADLDRLFAQIKQAAGRLDIVFANAGMAKYAALGTITEELYQSTFDISVKGVLFTVQKALPLLSEGASIILNSSIVGCKGLSMNSVYSATKAAVRSFARTWTTDLKGRGISERLRIPIRAFLRPCRAMDWEGIQPAAAGYVLPALLHRPREMMRRPLHLMLVQRPAPSLREVARRLGYRGTEGLWRVSRRKAAKLGLATIPSSFQVIVQLDLPPDVHLHCALGGRTCAFSAHSKEKELKHRI